MLALSQSLVIKNRIFPTNLIQAPLAGVSCAPFRALTWKYSQPAFSCTEMISCKTLNHQPLSMQRRFVAKDPAEGPVSFQLAAAEPTELAEAVKRVTDFGADIIDLNCGCPVKKIRSKGAGSSLLLDAPRLYQLIRAMRDNTHVPVSVKIRVEGGSDDVFNQSIATVVTEAGADCLVVHGRHWTEQYETPCNYDEIAFFVAAMKIPVIGNGDVACLSSLQRMLATGCAGVMVGRAGVGQPWLIGELTAGLLQQPFVLPTQSAIGRMFVEHIEKLIALLQQEKFAILQARKFAKYYARSLLRRAEFCMAMNGCETFSQFVALCDMFFGE